MNYGEQLSVVIGPVLITAVLGPLLLAVISRARKNAAAQAENYEVLSDKARFEAMDLLVNHMRSEVDRLTNEASTERQEAQGSRKQIMDLERKLRDMERTMFDLALWALSLIETMERFGFPVEQYPPKIQRFLASMQDERPTP